MKYLNSYGPSYSPIKPDRSRCAANVSAREGWGSYQCQRRAVCDPDESGKPTSCRQHSEAETAARNKSANDKYNAEMKKLRVQWAGPKMLAVLKVIADGHNDPRSLAAEAIDEIEKRK